MDCDVQYEIRYGIRGKASSISQSTISSLEFSRKLDDISKARIEHVLTDISCCDELGRLEPWSDTVEIRRNGDLVWMGWITSVEYTRSTVSVEAADALIWSRYRVFGIDYNKTQDSSLHFQDVWNTLMLPSPLPIDLVISNTNIIETRKYSKNFKRIGWFLLKEMIEGSLDVFVLGNSIHVGQLNLAGILHLNDDDFSGDITVRKAGELYANQVIVEGARQISGQFPTGTITGDGIYPLVQDLVFDESITSAASAESQAKSRYDFTSGIVPRVVRAGDALTLRQGSVELAQLIPSRIINLNVNGLCYRESQQFRLGSVDVNFAGGIENIGISLQPIGTLSYLEGITADDDRGAAIDA